MAAQRTMAESTLLSAGLLAAVLALITGILGMHVLTGTHSLHAAAAVSGAGAAAASPEASGHAGHGAAPQETAALQEPGALSGAASPVQCSCSGNCSSQHAMTASCIPSVAAGGPYAPPPDNTASIAARVQAPTTMNQGLWSYRPGSPSPGELSISRT